MVVMAAKVSKAKLIAVICILAAIVAIAAVIISGDGSTEHGTAPQVSVSTNEGRLAFLAEYGWNADTEPIETQDIVIPKEFDEVLSRYNELQRSQGYDLTRFAGKQVKRYVYNVTNYEGTAEPVYATLLVYKDAVIGGDITATGGKGLMHGFTKPGTAASSAAKLPAEPAAPEQEAPQPAAPETAA